MPKRKYNKSNKSMKTRSSNMATSNIELENNINDATEISSHSSDDFPDNTETTMCKRKKHIETFYNRTNKALG